MKCQHPDPKWRALRQLAPALALAIFAMGTAILPASAQSGAAKPAMTEQETVKALSDHFAAVPTMTGEFLQFGPNGEQTGGTFYIARPGKIRFNYQQTSPVVVISNGQTVAIHNRKLKTWDFYPLDKTPLKLLLSDRIDTKNTEIKSVINEPDLTTVVMGDDNVFGDAVITLMFDPESFDLRQWTVKDSKGAETSVMVFNVTKDVELPDRLFKFDELAIRRSQREKNVRQ